MDIKSEIARIRSAKSDIASAIADKGVTVPADSTIDAFGSLIRNIPAGGEGSGSGIIDVTELPTVGIDENAIYRITTQIEVTPLNMWLVMSNGIQTMRQVLGSKATIYIYLVNELSSDMETTNTSSNVYHIYVVESTGVAYLNALGMGVLTVGVVFALLNGMGATQGLDKGWTEDPYSIDLTNPLNYGIYITRAVYKDFVRLYSYKNSEWTELTAHISYEGMPECLSGEYKTEGVIEVKQNYATVDVTQYIVENKSLPTVVVDSPSTADLLYGFITEVTEDFFKGNTNHWTFRPYGFANCVILKSVDLPDTITEIPNHAFYNCANLLSVKLPSNLSKIDLSAFEYCNQLSLSELPDSLEYIEAYAFYCCDKMPLSKLPASLIAIAGSAFAGCNSIISLDIPATVTNLYSQAFGACCNLTSITFKGTPSNILYDVFAYCDNLTVINVPWSEGEVSYAPWGATNATINYNYTGE